jgi:hypothetical protein
LYLGTKQRGTRNGLAFDLDAALRLVELLARPAAALRAVGVEQALEPLRHVQCSALGTGMRTI